MCGIWEAACILGTDVLLCKIVSGVENLVLQAYFKTGFETFLSLHTSLHYCTLKGPSSLYMSEALLCNQQTSVRDFGFEVYVIPLFQINRFCKI
jgi:hypothetical protein